MSEAITHLPKMIKTIEDIQATLYKHLVNAWLPAEIDHLKQAALTQGQGRADTSIEEAFEQKLFIYLEQDTERNNLLKRYYYKAQTYKEHDVHRYTAAIRLILICLDPTDPFNKENALEVVKIHLGGDMNHPLSSYKSFKETTTESEDSEEDQVDIYSIVYKEKQKWEKAWPAIKAHLEKQSEAFVSDITYEYGTAGLFTVFATYKPEINIPKDVCLQHLRVSLAEVLKEELDIDSECI